MFFAPTPTNSDGAKSTTKLEFFYLIGSNQFETPSNWFTFGSWHVNLGDKHASKCVYGLIGCQDILAVRMYQVCADFTF
ncbi:hypothetical protein D6D25_08721 [Aureobasidium pullulans]|nr:hypothetical protein D6D25_08721 [Aureobasidium pullulans]